MKEPMFIRSRRLHRKRKKQLKRYFAWRAQNLGISTEDYEKLFWSIKRGAR